MSEIEQQARSIFLAAMECAPDEWPKYLDEACGANAELRARLNDLLQAHQALGSIHGAANSAGAAAVTYYDFRNNANATPGSGLPTDYFIVVNPNPVSNPSNWSETKLTDTSFNMENAAPTSRGYFLGDYQGLAAAGGNFYALFAQAGSDSSDPSNIWFRDPPPAAMPSATALASAGPSRDSLAASPAEHTPSPPVLGIASTDSGASVQPILSTFPMSMLEVARRDWDSLVTSLVQDWRAAWMDLVDHAFADGASGFNKDVLMSLAEQWENQAG